MNLLFGINWTELVFFCLPQQINESRGRIRSTLKNRLSEQAAERVSHATVGSNAQKKTFGLVID